MPSFFKIFNISNLIVKNGQFEKEKRRKKTDNLNRINKIWYSVRQVLLFVSFISLFIDIEMEFLLPFTNISKVDWNLAVSSQLQLVFSK